MPGYFRTAYGAKELAEASANKDKRLAEIRAMNLGKEE